MSESTNVLVNLLAAGLSGLLIWLSVEVSVERLRTSILKADGSPLSGSLQVPWLDHAVQSVNLAVVGVLVASPVEFRWLYFTIGLVAGALACALVYHLARRLRTRLPLQWLFP